MAKILSRSERKEISKFLENRFGISKFNLDLALSGKERMWIIPKSISDIYLDDLRIEFVGIYFGSYHKDSIRLSIEACQILGGYAEKNIYNLSEKELKLWLSGEEIEVEGLSKGYILLKYKSDFVGSAKYGNGKILNMLQKGRRIKI